MVYIFKLNDKKDTIIFKHRLFDLDLYLSQICSIFGINVLQFWSNLTCINWVLIKDFPLVHIKEKEKEGHIDSLCSKKISFSFNYFF